MHTRMTFPRYMEAISPQATSASFTKKEGPGEMPSIISAPIMMAVAPEPGTPKVSIGTMAPMEAALLAHSGAATPSITPVPNSSPRFEVRFAMS